MHGVRRALVAAIVVSLGACTALVDNYGYVPTEVQLEEVAVGQDTRDTVAQKVGAPPLDDFRRDDVWYYVSMRRETYGPRAPEETDRQVVAIRFSEGGSVTNIERFGLEDGQVVTLSRRITEQAVPDVGLLRGLFRNTALNPISSANDPL